MPASMKRDIKILININFLINQDSYFKINQLYKIIYFVNLKITIRGAFGKVKLGFDKAENKQYVIFFFFF